ncbi:MAG: GH3 auxin-responsive promoter family protein [Planctomycetia bacterium]|nr:GH3 auxin-responsive promoter family protein [Planctomycetia bacterium]
MSLSWLSGLARWYPIRRLLGWPIRRQLAAFDNAARDPRGVQEEVLRRILAAQANTGFGRDHGFGSIRTREDFRRQVGVLRYEDHEPYIARVRKGETNALLAEKTVYMFAMTSGTTASRKYIPVTPQYLADYRRAWNMWGVRAWQKHPEMRLRPIVQLAGEWDEFRTEAGIPCGALTGLTAHMQKRIVQWLYCFPPIAGKVKDAHAKYYVALRLGLPRKVGMLVAANPSTLLSLARTGDREKESLLRDLHNGTLSNTIDLPADVRAAITARLKPLPERARELSTIAEKSGTLYPKDYWDPRRLLIGTWTGGSMGAYLRQFPHYFGAAPIRDVGLVASEGRMTIPFDDHTPSGALDIRSHYFEFIPEGEIDRPQPTVLSSYELEVGKKYFILLTTAYGLYRYNIHDLVQVTGFHEQTPLVEFLSKGSHFSNITGEKLSEYQVTKAMTDLCQSFDLNLNSYTVAPCWDDERPGYGLFVEEAELRDADQGRQLAEALDRRLMADNTEYAAKRDSQRLDELRVQLLPAGALQRWDRQRLERSGGTLEQYKHPCLVNDLKFRESLSSVNGTVRTEATSLK